MWFYNTKLHDRLCTLDPFSMWLAIDPTARHQSIACLDGLISMETNRILVDWNIKMCRIVWLKMSTVERIFNIFNIQGYFTSYYQMPYQNKDNPISISYAMYSLMYTKYNICCVPWCKLRHRYNGWGYIAIRTTLSVPARHFARSDMWLTEYTRMGLLQDTWNRVLRMRRECRERFPRHRLQRKPLVSGPGMHRVMHVGIAYPQWRGKRSRHSRRMRNPQTNTRQPAN